MEGTGIRPSTRPDPVPERARADRSETPQRGHTLALRSISPRQLGHIRCAVSKETSSFDPKAERRDFFSRCSLNQILGGNSILRRTAWRRTNRATKTSKAPEGRGLFCNGKPRAYHPAAHGQLISGSRLRLACFDAHSGQPASAHRTLRSPRKSLSPLPATCQLRSPPGGSLRSIDLPVKFRIE